MKQLRSCLTTLYSFLSRADDKSILFFVALNSKESFEWTPKCKDDFTKVKNFLTPPSVLILLREVSSLLLYRSVTDQAINSVPVQEIDRAEKPVYFIIKVFRGAEAWYQKIENLKHASIIMHNNHQSCESFTIITQSQCKYVCNTLTLLLQCIWYQIWTSKLCY